MPLLAVRSVCKAYTAPVLEGIDFEVASGEIVALLGASGSGKTTLLNILAGLLAPDKGEVVASLRRPGPEIAYLSQDDSLLPWRSVLDNVALGLDLLGLPRHEARDWLERVGLPHCAGLYPRQLSGGMQQRVLLARTLALPARLLLLDEPSASLDLRARRDMGKILRDHIARTKAAALVVTHSVEEAVFLADRIVMLSSGPARVYRQFKGAGLEAVTTEYMRLLDGAA
jgi:NitT/TauT family transport system ATP-binding protein